MEKDFPLCPNARSGYEACLATLATRKRPFGFTGVRGGGPSAGLPRDAGLACPGGVDHVTAEGESMGPRERAALGDVLEAARDRAFVGRAAELALFRSALTGDSGACPVHYLHGPGGIGKSTLLRRFAREARRAGRPGDGRRSLPARRGPRGTRGRSALA
ncbi:ATP-binding protein [Streptomyces sp. NPDC050211]|uniref:ATP-binding protein n=1 Tax=Streptomyces sp. NPDC050211 TaxID=3154932 RepID=UPI0034157D9B